MARIKKIMRLDDDVRSMMIGSEVPVLLAKASEIFIQELALNSWKKTDENRRKTLHKSDVAQALAINEMYDFLIDIVPREIPKKLSQSGGAKHKQQMQMQDQQVQTVITDTSGLLTTDPGVQYVLQVGSGDGTLATGSVVQATQIGQPIQLPITQDSQPIQLITLSLPTDGIQEFQLQLPQPE
ncbi:unnamed protein product [Gongylonema pulchrum]|uniref:Transcription factor CBF/NF-Y/archaeal histone domain-containing protein n=1 Tax=Gongylonema pulchrum TaxID=637853 RepID=A0A3P6Q398_9BILA|nr:unnamed protein product [Gongylonema pulchrum]